MAGAVAGASASSLVMRCFNSNCKELLDRPRKGWRRRTGDFADLCDRCASAYEEGKFCESFHLNASGWRCCESCGKQIHCGCIVSFHMFVLLDAGGIECITCARKSFILTPNPAWPPPSLFIPLQPERIKDVPIKNWSPIAGSGPVPWRQAPSVFSGSGFQSELQSKAPFDLDVPGGIDRLRINERLSFTPMEKRKQEESFEKLMNGSLRTGASEIPGNGNAGADIQEQPNPCVNSSQQTAFPLTSEFSLGTASASKSAMNDHSKVSGTPIQQSTLCPSTEKRSCGQNQTDSSEARQRNGRARGDARGRNQLLPRYWPQITDEELRQISGNSNSVLTPLFQKMLSASDAGRIGRLVLPKKCAEAYFPPISNPEGIPLKIKDIKGKEWTFQFRFWPNNNSRMYVLEGITPCIQSMQLQAGDYVTFSRLEPEGKLVMGFKKASTIPSDQGNETCMPRRELSSNGDVAGESQKAGESSKPSEVVSTNGQTKSAAASCSFPPKLTGESQSTPSKTDGPGNLPKEGCEAISPGRTKRRNGTLGLKGKRVRIENEDNVDLEVSWEQVQGLLRPPPDKEPTVYEIDGFEIEEYEEPPVIGRPTIPVVDELGQNMQWVQCEDCFKWRKLPSDARLPARWTCSMNSWDSERSLCSAVEELSAEELEALLPTMNKDDSKKTKAPPKQDSDAVEALEGLDALAHLAVQEKAGRSLPASSQSTTKHPRHRVGCSCIVCIQPPSGKGPKHKQPCECVVCKSVKRRYRTLMMKREKKQSEKESEASQELQPQQLPEQVLNVDGGNKSPTEETPSDGGIDDNNADEKCSAATSKSQIDLNIQPVKEDEQPPRFDTGSLAQLIINARERQHMQQRLSALGIGGDVGNQAHQDGVGRLDAGNSVACLGHEAHRDGVGHPDAGNAVALVGNNQAHQDGVVRPDAGNSIALVGNNNQAHQDGVVRPDAGNSVALVGNQAHHDGVGHLDAGNSVGLVGNQAHEDGFGRPDAGTSAALVGNQAHPDAGNNCVDVDNGSKKTDDVHKSPSKEVVSSSSSQPADGPSTH